MSNDLSLRRKWTLRAHGKQVIFVKKSQESSRHVLLKAYIWALYLPDYPELLVEVKIGDRYKPDVVMIDAFSQPLFWGEAGDVGQRKIHKLVRRYRNTHFVMAKPNRNLAPFVEMVRKQLRGVKRTAPFDLLGIEDFSAEKYISSTGQVSISFDDISFVRIEP